MWKYLDNIADYLIKLRRLLEAVSRDNSGPYRRALVASVRRRTYSLGHKIIIIKSSIKGLPLFTKEDGTVLPGVLEYFTDAIIPFLSTFFTVVFDPSDTINQKEITIKVFSGLIVSFTNNKEHDSSSILYTAGAG